MLLCLIAVQAWAEEGPGTWDLIRVEDPDYPGAQVRSHHGSLLLEAPTDGTSWRVEPVPETTAGFGDYGAWEAVDAIGVEAWHAAGHRGQGVRVAVFDLKWSGTDLHGEELGDFQTHDCYTSSACTEPMDTLRPRFDFEIGQHGVACAEVIRDLAPEVELHLVRVNGLTTFENAAAWAVAEGIDVVSLSMSFFNDSFYDGTGAVARVVEELAEGNVLLVTSAGNYAKGHHTDVFRDTNGNGAHEFPWGSEYLPISLSQGGGKALTMNWDEYGLCGRNDLDLVLLNGQGDVVGRSERDQDPAADNCSPVERLQAYREHSGWYYLQVLRRSPSSSVRFDVLSVKGEIYQSMAHQSIPDPGSHPLALTIGAVQADEGYRWREVEGFSSQGPTLAGVFKPDMAAPDGLSTSIYGPSGFFGTSAAAPTTAAAVALVMSATGMSAWEAADFLRARALEEAPLWESPDAAMGAGRLHLGPPPAAGGCGGSPMAWVLFPVFWLKRRVFGREAN